MDNNGGHEPVPITPELLADLQAGLLDDDTAAALRQRVRVDPQEPTCWRHSTGSAATWLISASTVAPHLQCPQA